MSFRYIFFPNDLLPPNLKEHIAGQVQRNRLLKKQNQLADIYVIGKSRQNSRIVLQTYPHSEYGTVLVYVANFSLDHHDAYEKFLQKCKRLETLDKAMYTPVSLDEQANYSELEQEQPLSDVDVVEKYVHYRTQLFMLKEEQDEVATDLIGNLTENNKDRITMITGGAGAGKTLLSEKYLIAHGRQCPNKQLVYLCPSILLAQQMRKAMRIAEIHNVICIALSEIASQENNENNFKAFCSSANGVNKLEKDIICDYRKICQFAALSSNQSFQIGSVWGKLFELQTIYNNYRNYLETYEKVDLNLGIGFPLELLEESHVLVIDEYQQIPARLLTMFVNFSHLEILCLGDPHQTVNPAAIIVQHLMSSIMRSSSDYYLTGTHRVSLRVHNFANAVLQLKNKKFLQKASRAPASSTQTQAGNIYVVDKKHLPKKYDKLPITSAVVCITAEDRDKAVGIFGEAVVYSVPEILGLEFEDVIVFLPDQLVPMLQQHTIETKNTAAMNHADEISWLNMLYVAATRAKTSLSLICKNPVNFRGIFQDVTFSEFETFDRCSLNVCSRQDAIEYIRAEAETGYVVKAQQLYRQYIANNDGFLTFCAAFYIQLPNSKSYSQAISEQAKVLRFSRYLPERDLRVIVSRPIENTTNLAPVKYRIEKAPKPIRDKFIDDIVRWLLSGIQDKATIEESKKSEICKLLHFCFCSCSIDEKLLTPACSVLCTLLYEAKDTTTKGDAAQALTYCLQYTEARPIDHDNCIQKVYLALCGLINNGGNEAIKGYAAQTLAYCLQYTKAPPADHDNCIQAVYPVLCELITNARNEAIKGYAARALGHCAQYTSAQPVNHDNCIQAVYPALCELINNANACDEDIQSCAVRALANLLECMPVRPADNDNCIQAVYLTLCKLIEKAKDKDTKGYAAKALMLCLTLTEVRPAENDNCIQAVYPALCTLVKEARDESIKCYAMQALVTCLKYTDALPADNGNCIQAVYPVLCRLISNVSNNESIKGYAALALGHCLQCINARPVNHDNCIQKVYPVLCSLINNATYDTVKAYAVHALVSCFACTEVRPADNGNCIRAVYPALCTLVKEARDESIKYYAVQALVLCLNLTEAQPVDNGNCIRAVYPVLCELINNVRNDEDTKAYAAQALVVCLRRTQARPADNDNCIQEVYPALCRLVSNAIDDASKYCAVQALTVCLKYTEARPVGPDNCIKKLYPALCMLVITASDEEIQGHAAQALAYCLQRTPARPADNDNCIKKVYPALCKLIMKTTTDTVTKGYAALALVACLKCTRMRPDDNDHCLQAVRLTLIELEKTNDVQTKMHAKLALMCLNSD